MHYDFNKFFSSRIHQNIFIFCLICVFSPYEWGLREGSVLGQTSVWAKLRSGPNFGPGPNFILGPTSVLGSTSVWAQLRSLAQLQSGPNFGLGPTSVCSNFGMGPTSVWALLRCILLKLNRFCWRKTGHRSYSGPNAPRKVN